MVCLYLEIMVPPATTMMIKRGSLMFLALVKERIINPFYPFFSEDDDGPSTTTVGTV